MRNITAFRIALALLASGLVFAGCGSAREPNTTDTPESAVATTPDTTTTPESAVTTTPNTKPEATETTYTTDTSGPLAGRPFDVVVPLSYDRQTPAPLLVVLHGYTASGTSVRDYFGLQSQAEARGFLAVYPDGSQDYRGAPFWNATDACCNLGSSAVDDVAYLAALIDRVRTTYNVDPKRIYLAGHSNGGFMSYRFACERADTIAAVVSLAGATFADPTACRPSGPVNVLQIHGTSDPIINYVGGQIAGRTFPGASATVAAWASYNGCSPTIEGPPAQPDLDLEDGLPGSDTRVSAFAGCEPGGSVELWTIDRGVHSPDLSSGFPGAVIDFLYAHPKP